MISAIPFCSKDTELVSELLSWIKMLGRCENHTCLLIADAGVTWWKVQQLVVSAKECFGTVTVTTTERSSDDWIEGSNSLFITAAQYIEENLKASWLWLEPDSVPLKNGWLDAIENLYRQANKKFLGFIYEFSNPEPPIAPFHLMSGVAVYPPEAWSDMVKAIKFSPTLAFDVSCAAITTGEGLHTNLIQHFYGERGLPPTFVETQTAETPRNAFGIDKIHPNAVLFHRCKDGSLINLLRIRLLPHRFVVVFPFCNRDGNLLVKNLQWMQYLGGNPNETAVLAYDHDCDSDIVRAVEREAKKTFGIVLKYLHVPPKNTSAPWAANHVFRSVSAYINSSVRRPFLWFEPDMVPLRRGWLERLQSEYLGCGKPFFGSIVPGMGHFNGTAIYPADVSTRCPSIRQDIDAFDMVMRGDTEGQVFNASHLIQCAWVMDHRGPQPYGGGELPRFRSREDVRRWILPTALLFHRDKALTLVDRLSEMGI